MAEYFDVLKSVISKQDINNEDIEKHFVGFQAVKWLSINPMACYKANELNSSRGIKFVPKSAEYRFLKFSIKLPKNTFLKETKKDKDYYLIMSSLSEYFKAGQQTVNEYLKILSGNKLLKILEDKALVGNDYTSDPSILELRKAISNKKEEILKGFK